MPLSTLQIADYLKRDPSNRTVREMLRESISPTERNILDFICKLESVTTEDVSKKFKTTIPSAGNMLLRLLNYDLIERLPDKDEHGTFYNWVKHTKDYKERGGVNRK